ncbi:tripartite tricarboxylate transporter substrate binding protein [soil metagenome]
MPIDSPRRRSQLTAMALFATVAALASSPALAQSNWPDRPLTIIVPGAPGGTLDLPTRVVAQKLSQRLGQPVIVENRAGAGGIIGTQGMLRAPADGYTLLSGNTGPQAINYSAYKSLPYKPEDLAAVTDVIGFGNVLVVNPQSPIKSVADLVAEMKKPDAKVSYASAGIGQTTHLTAEFFKIRTGGAALHVPYRGSTPATTAVMAGETTFLFDNATQSLPHIRGGKLRALAVTTAERDPNLPDVPTMAEAGLPGFVSMGWMGIFVSSRTPPEIFRKLADNLIAVMHDPEVMAQIRTMGGIPGGKSPKEFEAFVASERERWGSVVKASNIVLE